MGGTSTDVCLIAGRESRTQRGAGGRQASRSVSRWSTSTPWEPAAAPIVWRDEGGALRVGPTSAGAEPGACLLRPRRDGTDGDGRQPPPRARCRRRLPGGLELDARRSGASARRASTPPPSSRSSTQRCCGPCASSRSSEGHDPREFALVAFGGAGPLHACGLADELGVSTVLVPEAAGVLSALGLVASDETTRSHRLRRSAAERGRELPGGGGGEPSLPRPVVRTHRRSSVSGLAERFHEAHEARYGYADTVPRDRARRPANLGRRAWADARADDDRAGPLGSPARELVELAGATCWVPEGWARRARTRRARSGWSAADEPAAIPVELQVLGSALRAIAEEMGAVLIRAAFSSNIKERRDCSTALFDAAGRMVVQAEHIPVHLGAMPEAVAAVMSHDPRRARCGRSNDPYTGGTHLPDITLVTTDGARLRRQPRASRGRRRDGAGEPACRLDGSLPGGADHPPTRLDEGLLRPDRRELAKSRRAPR